MVAGIEGSKEALFLRSDGDLEDLVFPGLTALFFKESCISGCWISWEEAMLVRFRGGACVWSWSISTCAIIVVGVKGAGGGSSSLHCVASRCVLVALEEKIGGEKDGAFLEMGSTQNHVVESLTLSGALRMHSNLKMSVVLQALLHMSEGIFSSIPHCSTRLGLAVRGMCWTWCVSHKMNAVKLVASWLLFDQISEVDLSLKDISDCWLWMHMLLQNHCWWHPTACRPVSACSSFDFQCSMSGGGTLYSLQADGHDEYAFLLFGTCRRRVRASLLRFLRFNSKEPPGLSSVMAHLDLQLIPLPQRHLPTRLLVEPLALRLARLQEAPEECDCRYVESEFSTDPLAGSGCALLHKRHVSTVILICVQLGNSVYQGECCNVVITVVICFNI